MPRLGPPPTGWHTLCGLALIASLASAACTHQRTRTQVVLAWDYTQPSPPIDGFLVQRRTGTDPARGGPRWRDAAHDNRRHCPSESPLCYQVLAYREQEHSPPSNEVCLTISAATQS